MTTREDILSLADKLVREADDISRNLTAPGWRPTRSRIEDARNLLRRAAALLAAPTPPAAEAPEILLAKIAELEDRLANAEQYQAGYADGVLASRAAAAEVSLRMVDRAVAAVEADEEAEAGEEVDERMMDRARSRARDAIHNAQVAGFSTPPPAKAPGQESVAVKPLEWREARISDQWERFSAETLFGSYEALEWSDGGYGMTALQGEEFTFETMAEAKAAAQTDYDRRIRSALVSAPPPYADAESPWDIALRLRLDAWRAQAKHWETVAKDAEAEGLEKAAKFVRKLIDDYVSDHGSFDPETGATEFPGNGEEYVGSLEEIEEGIRSLASPATKGET